MMKRRFRKLAGLLAVLLAAAALPSCSAGNEDLISGSSGTDETGEQTKLVFLRAGTEENKKTAFTELIRQFEDKYPNYTVEYQEAPWGDDMETKLNTGFASGTAPDVINFSLASIGARVPLGQYEPLNEYVEDWEGKDDYYESVLEAGSIGDNLYGIGYLADARVFVYNTELFEKAGLDPDSPPTNWEELKEYHEKLVVRDDDGNVIQTGLAVATNGTNINQWLQIFMMQNGVTNLVDEATDEILFNTPEAVEAMNFLKELNDIGLVTWDNSQSDQNPFKNGTAAMTVTSENEYTSMNTGELEGKLRIGPMFSNKSDATFCGMHFMFMSSDSKNKDAAWDLIEFLTSKDSMQVWIDTVGTSPLRSSLESYYLEKNPENGPYILNAIETGRGSAKVPYFNTMFNIVDNAMEQVFYGEASVEDALNAAAEKLQEEIDNQ